jgi:hypothetical protein
MNLKQFKPENDSWVKELIAEMGADDFITFVSNVFNALEAMQFGGHFYVQDEVDPEAFSLFVKSACLFMDWTPGYNFTEDYTIIIRDEYDDPTKWIKGNPKKGDVDGDGEFFPSGQSGKNVDDAARRAAS